MINIKEEKQKLRCNIENERHQLSDAYLSYADKKIYENILELPQYRMAETVFCFVSTKSEIHTLPILEDVLASGKCLAVPRCVGDGVMEAYQIKGLHQLEPGRYGILEPRIDCPLIIKDQIDFAVVPCISCDGHGYRLGHGGGYYDRYLKQASFPAVVICRSKLVCERIPVEPWDLRMDMSVTEEGVIYDTCK